MSKILKSNFSRDDLLKCYEMIYNQSYQMEEPNIDFNLPKKMNTLINFSNSQKAVSFLYSKYDLSFITTVVGKNTIEIKNDILISARKFKEVYI